MGQRICSIPSCDLIHHARGLCVNHYQLWLRWGDTLVPPPKPPIDMVARLEAKIDRSTSGCPLWSGTLDDDGYGKIKIAGKTYRAHRLLYSLTVCELDADQVVDHECHDPAECQLGRWCTHRRCMDVTHMRAKTNEANVLRGGGPPAIHARKDVCLRGHDFVPRKTGGGRYCPTCKSLRRKGLI